MLDGFAFVREIGAPGAGEASLNLPLSVVVNREGQVLVSDACNRIVTFDGQGQYIQSFGVKGKRDGFFNYPVNMAINDEDALFVCDQGNNRIQVLNASTGAFLHKWGGSKKKKGSEEEAAEAPAEGEAEDGDEPQ